MPELTQSVNASTLHCLPGMEVLEVDRAKFRFGRRARAEYTMMLVKEGAEQFIHRGRFWIAPKGSLILINPDEAYPGGPVQSTRSFAAIYPSLDLLRQFLPERAGLIEPAFLEPVVRDTTVLRKFSSLIDSAFSAHTPLGLQCGFVELMMEVVSKHALAGRDLRRKPDSAVAVRRVRERLASVPEQAVGLKELAHENGMHPVALLRAFQLAVGCTPHVFQVSHRLRFAKRLLRLGNSISYAAHACGFTDQSHLTNTFRRWTSMTPTQYLQSIRTA